MTACLKKASFVHTSALFLTSMADFSQLQENPVSAFTSDVPELCRTPTSEDHKIPPILTCPPAPRTMKRKFQDAAILSVPSLELFSVSGAATVMKKKKKKMEIEVNPQPSTEDGCSEWCRTPTSEDHKIPPILSGPPAPRKQGKVSRKFLEVPVLFDLSRGVEKIEIQTQKILSLTSSSLVNQRRWML